MLSVAVVAVCLHGGFVQCMGNLFNAWGNWFKEATIAFDMMPNGLRSIILVSVCCSIHIRLLLLPSYNILHHFAGKIETSTLTGLAHRIMTSNYKGCMSLHRIENFNLNNWLIIFNLKLNLISL